MCGKCGGVFVPGINCRVRVRHRSLASPGAKSKKTKRSNTTTTAAAATASAGAASASSAGKKGLRTCRNEVVSGRSCFFLFCLSVNKRTKHVGSDFPREFLAESSVRKLDAILRSRLLLLNIYMVLRVYTERVWSRGGYFIGLQSVVRLLPRGLSTGRCIYEWQSPRATRRAGTVRYKTHSRLVIGSLFHIPARKGLFFCLQHV